MIEGILQVQYNLRNRERFWLVLQFVYSIAFMTEIQDVHRGELKKIIDPTYVSQLEILHHRIENCFYKSFHSVHSIFINIMQEGKADRSDH